MVIIYPILRVILISAVFQIPETKSVVGRNVLTDFVSFTKRKQSQATQIHSWHERVSEDEMMHISMASWNGVGEDCCTSRIPSLSGHYMIRTRKKNV